MSVLAAFPEVTAAGAALVAAGLTVAVAESCTGGLLGAALTALPGSSRYMRGGVIAYADDVKVSLLGVGAGTLAAHGAVSEEVAAEMAAGARRALGADVGLGVTGVAGPGAEGRKPPGLVFVAVSADAGSRVSRLRGDRGREANRERAVRLALQMCRDAAAGGPGRGEDAQP